MNNGDLTFTDRAPEFGLDARGYTTHAAFFDYDLDGDLDCYVLNNSFIPVNTLNYSNKRTLRAKDWPVEDFLKGGGSVLYRNDSGKFIDVSEEAGIYGSLISFGLGITIGDINNDLYPDIFVSNDFFERDYLYINQRNGKFKEDLENRIQHTSLASMGADLADINNDGHPEIFTTDMLPGDDYRLKTTSLFEGHDIYQYKLRQGFYHQLQQNTLQVNDGTGNFLETGYYSGVAASDWSWGALMADFDNDGLSDIYVCNGIYKDVIDQDFIDFFANDVIQRMVMTGQKKDVQSVVDSMPSVPIPNKIFRNTGNLRFEDVGMKWGMMDSSYSNGAAYGDLDNDGDLDMIVSNVNMPAFIYQNTASETLGNNYLCVKLQGPEKNRFAIGAIVKAFSGNKILTRELIPTRGFQSSVDYKINFGLGKSKVDSVLVYWPDKSMSRVIEPQLNAVLRIEHSGTEPARSTMSSEEQIFSEWKTDLFTHAEDPFVDFYNERNVPVMLSREGPCGAVADIDGDGDDDFFVGGARGQESRIFLQNESGFIPAKISVLETHSDFEDVTALFFDVDNDRDQDLFVGSGGGNLPPGHALVQHRLYINDGRGNFKYDSIAFPKNLDNAGVAVPSDVDGDGDLDLFVGSRSVSYNYGAIPTSYLYINNSGKFSIAIAENLGMVTDATWVDVDGDKQKELIVVGEWMSPQAFSFHDGKFVKRSMALENFSGWWQSISAGDLDNDGDIDLVFGNVGENFYLRPDSASPVKLWINDYDGNTTIDKVFSRTVNGGDVPVFLKKDFTDALPAFKKQNLRHSVFAKQTIQTLFDRSRVVGSEIRLFNYSSSCIAINNGKGSFTVKPLPFQSQLSSINDLVLVDVDQNGYLDILCAGNLTVCLPQFGRLDASQGTILINKGNLVFDYVPATRAGLRVNGMTREILELSKGTRKLFAFLRNNEPALFYKLNSNNGSD